MTIKPYVGFDDIKFGMSEEEVNYIAGEPKKATHIHDLDGASVIVEQLRDNACFQFQAGKLACITFNSEALSANKVTINGVHIPPAYFELIKTLNRMAETKIRVRNPSGYLYYELGAVVYQRQIIDIRMGNKHTDEKHILAICNHGTFQRYYEYFWRNMKDENDFNTTLFDAMQIMLDVSDEDE